MADPNAFAKLVPGFDFLQGLMSNASAAVPGMSQWVAPTLNPEELDKRIEELRTVQFWLEQNARMLGATIQALEVQRMTLSTLRTMNVSIGDLAEAMTVRVPKPSSQSSPPAGVPHAATKAPHATETPTPADAAAGDDSAATAAGPGVVDPMQWWGALTKQFTELATKAMKETTTDAARKLAGAMVANPLPSNAPAAGARAAKAKTASAAKHATKAPARRAAAKP